MQRMHKNCTLKTLKLRDHRIEDCIALHILSSPTISGSMQGTNFPDLRGKQKDRKMEISFLRVVLKRGEARLPFSSCLDAEVDCHEESYR